MKTPTIPVGLKFVSILIGVAITGLLLALEVPLEGILAAVLPLFGILADAAVDGLEVVLAPMLFACCALSLFVKADQLVASDKQSS